MFLGYDDREPDSFVAAQRSLLMNTTMSVMVAPLDERRLADRGLLRRMVDKRGNRYDLLSNANASTDFAISRFLPPILCQQGWALFADSDVIFMRDVAELYALRDPSKALQVVQHGPLLESGLKMDGQKQQPYNRKNWSSVMLFNCDHPANRRLSLADIQERRGLDLHHFYWLADSEIGALPGEWNWLVGVQPKPENPGIAHFTLGTPELGVTSEHDDIWRLYAPPTTRQATG